MEVQHIVCLGNEQSNSTVIIFITFYPQGLNSCLEWKEASFVPGFLKQLTCTSQAKTRKQTLKCFVAENALSLIDSGLSPIQHSAGGMFWFKIVQEKDNWREEWLVWTVIWQITQMLQVQLKSSLIGSTFMRCLFKMSWYFLGKAILSFFTG